MNRIFTVCFAIIVGLTACDVIDSPYVEPIVGQGDPDPTCVEDAQNADPFDGVNIQRKVLFTEMTGHKCGNCPKESEKAYDMYTNTYQGRMVFMTLHAGFFSRTSTKFPTDFTTTVGDELFQTFNPQDAVPFALINRVEREPGVFTHGTDLWTAAVESEIAKSPSAGIHIKNCYEESDRKLTTVVDILSIDELPANTHLSIFVVEDGIVDWQKDYRLPRDNQDIEDYVHHYVIRDALNGTWGQPISSEATPANRRLTVSYAYTIPDNFNADNCYIVAFLHNFESRYVYQAEERRVVEK
ncbi:MAG: Omp28-related outer membrane protein [Bacteroidota bacterium]